MKFFLSILIVLVSLTLYADIPATTDAGRKVMLKMNGTWYFPEDQPKAGQKPKLSVRTAKEAVAIWDTSLQHWDKDTSIRRFSNYVALTFHYHNKTERKIIGVVVRCSIRNAFGKVMYQKTFEDEIIIKPKQRLRNTTFWTMKDNPFINGQSYDKLKMSAMNGTAKIKTKVLKVVFADGTVLKAGK